MTIFRTTFKSLANQSVGFINQNSRTIQKLQETLASGKSINRVSDDPIQSVRLLDITELLKTDEQYKRNIGSAMTEVDMADTALNSVIDIIQRAKELATQGATAGNDQNNLDAIALEIDELIKQTVQLANTQLGDKYLFGGKVTQTAPFAQAGNDITYSGNVPTAAWQRNVEIGKGVTVPVNLNGENIFGKVDVNAVGPPVTFTGANTTSGIFQTLTTLKLNLQAGSAADVRLRLDDLDTDLNTVLNQQSSLGSVRNRLEKTQINLEDREIFLSEQYANIQDVNLPELITELTAAENTYQMTLASTARVIQPSLMQFLN